MWADSRTEYVLRHFRYFYDLPDIRIGYGSQSAEVNISDHGKSFFGEQRATPPFRIHRGIPVLFYQQDAEALYHISEDKLFFNADLIAAVFFLLSGWQELYAKRESEDRFLAKESWQGQNGFERMPLVNSYFAILAEGISQLTGQEVKLKSLTDKPVVFLSHDIDKIKSGRTEGSFNALKNKDFKSFVKGVSSPRDPWHNLTDIARLEDSCGARSTFFFLAEKGKAAGGVNSDYRIESKSVQRDLVYLRDNDWEVAVHGSIGSHLDTKLLLNNHNKVNPAAIGNRYHFLNFKTPETIAVLEKAGFKYDASLGFADRVGYRNGCSFPFKLYDLQNERTSEILEIPLMVMDTTLHHSKYMSLSTKEAQDLVNEMYTNAVESRGIFSLLWHNNYFSDLKYKGWREVYFNFLSEKKEECEFLTGKQIYQLYEQI